MGTDGYGWVRMSAPAYNLTGWNCRMKPQCFLEFFNKTYKTYRTYGNALFPMRRDAEAEKAEKPNLKKSSADSLQSAAVQIVRR